MTRPDPSRITSPLNGEGLFIAREARAENEDVSACRTTKRTYCEAVVDEAGLANSLQAALTDSLQRLANFSRAELDVVKSIYCSHTEGNCGLIALILQRILRKMDALPQELEMMFRNMISEYELRLSSNVESPSQTVHPVPAPVLPLETATRAVPSGMGNIYNEVRMKNGRYLLQVPFDAQTVHTLMQQWDEGLWGLRSVRQMKADREQFALDSENKARYYRRVDIVNTVDELEGRGFATKEEIIENLERYRMSKHLSLYALNEKLKRHEIAADDLESYIRAL